LEDDEAIRLEYTASYDIIPLRIQTLLQAMQNYEADLYLLSISGDSIVHDQGLAGQAAFMKRLDEEFPALIEGIAAQAKEFTLIMFSDHGPRPIQGHVKPEEFLAGIGRLIFAGEDRNAAVVSNGRGSLYLYVRNPNDKTAWRRTAYRQLRDYHGHDILAAVADHQGVAFVICNREEGGIAILSAEGEATLSAADGGFLYQLALGEGPVGPGRDRGSGGLGPGSAGKNARQAFPLPPAMAGTLAGSLLWGRHDRG